MRWRRTDGGLWHVLEGWLVGLVVVLLNGWLNWLMDGWGISLWILPWLYLFTQRLKALHLLLLNLHSCKILQLKQVGVLVC